jgi:hypothetical protein
MNKHSELAFTAIAVVLLAPACSPEPGGEGHEPTLTISDVPRSFQGFDPQGFDPQGFDPQGFDPQGFDPQGTDIQGFVLQSFANQSGSFTDVVLNKTEFSGFNSSGAAISGAAFIGSMVTGTRQNGSPVTLRIDNIQPTADPEVNYYTLSYDNGSGWINPCGTRDGVPVRAIPLTGQWDYNPGTPTGGDHIPDSSTFTFSCTTGVLAKCMLAGYKPWATFQECKGGFCQSLPGRAFHQACTRMYRADYCGRGTPNTVNGTMINLYDGVGVQYDASPTLPLEAEWTPEGAKCVKHLRWTSGGQAIVDAAKSDIRTNCPEVRSPQALASCGSNSSTFTTTSGYSTHINGRVLLRNESEAPPSGSGFDDEDTTD